LNLVIKLLFTPEFLPVISFVLWQLAGDILSGPLILGYQFFAKKNYIAFVITEIVSLLLLYF
jgi:PST family polysaccharide transporter